MQKRSMRTNDQKYAKKNGNEKTERNENSKAVLKDIKLTIFFSKRLEAP